MRQQRNYIITEADYEWMKSMLGRELMEDEIYVYRRLLNAIKGKLPIKTNEMTEEGYAVLSTLEKERRIRHDDGNIIVKREFADFIESALRLVSQPLLTSKK